MTPSRRQFFGILGAALAGATLDPERLLWRPGAKTIFLPSPNDNSFGFKWCEDKRLYQIGDTIRIVVPQRFMVRAGEEFFCGPFLSQYKTITITNGEMANYDWSKHDQWGRV